MTQGPYDHPGARPTDRGVDSIAHLDDRGQALALDHRSTSEQHPCVVPDCGQHARTAFAAREHGRLAARDWQPGDVIDLCAPHANDVYRAQGEYNVDKLAAWLRPDAKRLVW